MTLNRLKQIKNPDTTYTEYGYDFRGNRSSLRTPNSSNTSYEYDALNRLASVIQPGAVTTVYGYNLNNNLTSVQDANNNTTTYKYDDKGRVYQVISPDTGTTTYLYDPAGNMISKTDAKGVTISYQYDALNRLTKLDFPGDTDIIYGYDACVNGKGRLCTMTDASGWTAYEYTPKGQVNKETKVIDSVTYVTQYTYDQNGNLKTMTYPSGRVITYNYSNDKVLGVLNNAANLASNINNKPFGGVSSLTYSNGIVGTIGYDNQYRVSSITAGAVMNLSYSQYDANGNIQSITNILDATKNKSFTYDALDRLDIATAAGLWGAIDWDYDGVGNRTTEITGAGTNTYVKYPGTNKLQSVTGPLTRSFDFDANGNTWHEDVREFVYNHNQRLVQVVDAGVTKGEYTYNGNGQRVKKIVNGTTTIFHYSLSGRITAESNSAGTITAEYVYLTVS
jgi:YD repeat-containing protein